MIYPLLGVWQFLWVWAFGFAIERRLRLDLSYPFRAAVAFALGEIVLSGVYFGLGLVGGLSFKVEIPLAVLISLFLFPSFFLEIKTIFTKALPYIKSSPLITAISITMFIIYALGCCVPEREVDAVWYHLGVPLYYITHGGFIQLVPFNLPSHYPMSFHLHYTFSLLVGNEMTAKAFNMLHFIPTLLLLWAVASRYIGRDWGIYTVPLYLCCLQFHLPVMANVERAVYFYVILSTFLLWIALEEKSRKLFILASVFCGMAMACKFSGLLFGYVAQWLLLFLWIFIFRRIPLIQGFGQWCLHSALSWLMMSPWMIKSYLYTNNPFYPMLGQFFNTKPEFVHAMLSNDKNHGLNILKSKSFAAFFGQIKTNLDWFSVNADLIFFLGFVATLAVVCSRKKEWFLPAVSGLAAYFLFTMMWGNDIARLFGANCGILIILITMLVAWICDTTPRWRWIYYLVVLSVVLTFAGQKYSFLSSPNIRWYGEVYLTEESRENWLAERNLFSKDYFMMGKHIKQFVPENDELYGYRTGYLFYLSRKNIVSDAHTGEQMDIWLKNGSDATLAALKHWNVKWVLVQSKTLPKEEPLSSAWKEFSERYLTVTQKKGEAVLYKLN